MPPASKIGPPVGCARSKWGIPPAVIDCHVHLAALRTKDNGCYISPRLLNSLLFRFLRWNHRLPIEDAAQSNQKYVEDLLLELRRSKYVKKAVLLGMDGVYDTNRSEE